MPPSGNDELPEPYAGWVRHERRCLVEGDHSPELCQPLVLRQGDDRLVVRFLGSRSGAWDLLVLEQRRDALLPADLASLGLSPRETEVLCWVARGQTDKEVATSLGIRLGTVGKHLEHVYAKLGVTGRTAAVARAVAGFPGRP